MTQETALTNWLTSFREAVTVGSFVKLKLSKPHSAGGDLKSIDIRPIIVKRVLKLSFTYHHQTRDIVKNYLPEESATLLSTLLTEKFSSARLYTLDADVQIAKTASVFTLTRHPPTQTEIPALSHDRAKQRLIESAGKPYLHALGIADSQGKVNKNSYDKFSQINKYIEILDGLIKRLSPRETWRIVDMGAGKGYLTFALYDYLTNTLKLDAEITGVEYRIDLVQQCNDIALASGFKKLKFVQGSITDYDCTGANIVIALHACDTATDDAIFKAIRAHAELIVVAPCCHKQIRREMSNASIAHLDFLMKYGTYVERIAEMATDGLRAQLLELNNYHTNLFEFISDSHTPKNVMIVATLAPTPLKPAEYEKLQTSIAQIKTRFGIATHRLEQLLNSQ